MLPKLTKEQRNKTIEILRTAQLYMQIGLNPKQEARMVSRVYFGDSDAPTDSTEEVAIKNADAERERLEFVQRVMAAVESLNTLEQRLIEKAYLVREEPSQVALQIELGLGQSTFYEVKNDALARLALMFGVVPLEAVPVPTLRKEVPTDVQSSAAC